MSVKRKFDGRHCGAGDLGAIAMAKIPVGLCPDCDAVLSFIETVNPDTKRLEVALVHAIPFCHYFGATAPEVVLFAMHSIASGTQSTEVK